MENTSETSCRICGHTAIHSHYHPREMMYGSREVFSYFQCANCDCLQIIEFPEDMSHHYPSDYYSLVPYKGNKFKGRLAGLKRNIYKSSALGQGFLSYFFKIREFECLRKLNLSVNSRILDVGCGNGRNFLYYLAESGFENLLGVDPYLPADIEYPNGLTIKKAEIFDIKGQWDVITYHHVFEHLPNPMEHLMAVYKLLSDNGACIIRIPTVSSFAWEHYKTNWVQLDAPRHFFLHSMKSMEILSAETNFKIAEVIFDSTHFQFSGSEKYKMDIPLNAKRKRGISHSLKRKLDKFNYGRKARYLNRHMMGDQAIFILKKI